ncbi:paired amphipathic helix protein Sin3a-like protein [Dinothrombium tinctorium]|uniref:Paired amphipathic helix protein Sin3a n=1 Tax=Dinothrombium tinctorium TaxID=1965070 RepID=A0A3S3QVX9_9ACAR|nr:paired amphipathic helix protein Sin3a-like protein [Dinothrombium tinctorium]RWS12391.1 paired amphipathic helix protein Sin3a-like protein [Dinothrombium tinctorium]RWS14852.1 paired amphipathic helix protein Sin3a-like protein [Dinothrombium tinctorium]
MSSNPPPAHVHLRQSGGSNAAVGQSLGAPSVISMSWATATTVPSANIPSLSSATASGGGGDTVISQSPQTIRVIPGPAASLNTAPPSIATAFVTTGAPSTTPAAPVTAATVFVSNEPPVAGKPTAVIGQTQMLHAHDGGNSGNSLAAALHPLPTSGHQSIAPVLTPASHSTFATGSGPPQAHCQPHGTVLTAPPATVLTMPGSSSPASSGQNLKSATLRPGLGIIQEASKSLSVGQSHAALHIAHSAAQGAMTQAQSQQQQQQFQRLKVEDALSYLDQVKFKFNNQPQVYNDFLDIMKEFKSQSIDTPGVIQRVSNLFKGHPELIVGFNTFLPPGYKIEMQANDQVNVSMPSSALIIQTTSGATTLVNTSSHVGTSNPLASLASTHHSVQHATVHQTTSKSSFANSMSQQAVHQQVNPNIRSGTAAIIEAHHAPQTQTGGNAIHGNSTSSLSLGATGNGVGSGSASASGTQPVEFNHAINYVNKIKNRFQGQPEVYKQFLEILHAYQKEQKILKEGKQTENKPLTESEVYQQVAKLFKNQEDLLQEFGQFLPDANGPGPGVFAVTHGVVGSGVHGSALSHSGLTTAISATQNIDSLAAAHRAASNDHGAIVKKPLARSGSGGLGAGLNHTSSLHPQGLAQKRSSTSLQQSQSQQPQSQQQLQSKRPKMTSLRDVSLAEAGKYGSLNEFAFFDKVRKALRVQEVYDNFLRCLLLYNHEVVSRSELVLLVTPFLGKFPELLKWFKDFLGCREGGSAANANSYSNTSNTNILNSMEGLPQRVVGIRERERERINSEVGMEIDYASCKRYGASYRALPKNYPQPKCSGRTPLCKEVLNDTWVSFPSWSEDSTFVTSRKTQFEEYIYRCEDERFELDVVIETNLATIRVLEAVQKKLSKMTYDERNKFRLDDCLGGTSAVIHQRAIRRIYGDKAVEIIEGLKKNPAVAVPLVLRRLKAKEEEWREAQKQFNKVWREQNEKYYLKSLDHQGISFKQNDTKYLRSKSLLNEIETIYEERHEQNEENVAAAGGDGTAQNSHSSMNTSGPHMTLMYSNKSMIEEACNLIIHHVKRQTSIHKEDKQKIKQLLRHFVPDLFSTPRGDLSDDEIEEMEVEGHSKSKDDNGNNGKSKVVCNDKKEKQSAAVLGNNNHFNHNAKNGNQLLNNDPDDSYTLLFGNNNWYLFFRLHHILCERLDKMYKRSVILAMEEEKERSSRKESTAVALKLKPRNDYDVDEYFPAFVDMVKQVLDGNLDYNQYEDQLREMFGIHAYIAFTMDKVVQNIVRQLQHLVCDEICYQCTELFIEESKNQATGGLCSTAASRFAQEYNYQKKCEQLLSEEPCFKIIIYKGEGKLTVELLDTEAVESESEDGFEVEKWSEYVEKYVRDDETISDELKEKLAKKAVFLPRNIRTWREKRKNDEDEEKDESGMKVTDDTQCKFNVNSYKMVFVAHSESYLCKRMALTKARTCHKQVSERLYTKFKEWHQKWLQLETRSEQQHDCEEWLLGRIYEEQREEESGKEAESNNAKKESDLSDKKQVKIKLKTVKIMINDSSKPPYRPYCKYKLQAVDTSPTQES